MAKLEQMDGPIWALDWLSIIVGLVLLAAWVLSAHELSFLSGLGLFILGCALRKRWHPRLHTFIPLFLCHRHSMNCHKSWHRFYLLSSFDLLPSLP